MASILEIQKQLQELTNTEIKQSDIAKALNTGRANISLRIKNKSRLTFEEIKKLENYFNVSIRSNSENTLERYYDAGLDIKSKLADCRVRITEIQNRNSLSSRQMAGLLDITEADFLNLKEGRMLPDISILCNLKQNFKVSADWILFGC